MRKQTSLLSARGWLYVMWSTMDLPDDCLVCAAFDGEMWWTVESFAPWDNHMEEGHPDCMADHCGCSFVIVGTEACSDLVVPPGLPQDIYDYVETHR